MSRSDHDKFSKRESRSSKRSQDLSRIRMICFVVFDDIWLTKHRSATAKFIQFLFGYVQADVKFCRLFLWKLNNVFNINWRSCDRCCFARQKTKHSVDCAHSWLLAFSQSFPYAADTIKTQGGTSLPNRLQIDLAKLVIKNANAGHCLFLLRVFTPHLQHWINLNITTKSKTQFNLRAAIWLANSSSMN